AITATSVQDTTVKATLYVSVTASASTASTLVVTPANPVVVLGSTQQFTASGAVSWSAVSGSITATGLYTSPATLPATGADKITASSATGQGSTTITLVSNTPPAIAQATPGAVPLGVFSLTLTGTGFTALSQVT